MLVLAAVLLTAFLFLISQNERLSSTLVPSRQTAPPVVVQPSAVTEKEPITVRETVIQTEVQWATKTATASAPVATPTKTKVLVVLPKDKRTGGDFGFREGGWLDAAIENRQEYADAHGTPPLPYLPPHDCAAANEVRQATSSSGRTSRTSNRSTKRTPAGRKSPRCRMHG